MLHAFRDATDRTNLVFRQLGNLISVATMFTILALLPTHELVMFTEVSHSHLVVIIAQELMSMVIGQTA